MYKQQEIDYLDLQNQRICHLNLEINKLKEHQSKLDREDPKYEDTLKTLKSLNNRLSITTTIKSFMKG